MAEFLEKYWGYLTLTGAGAAPWVWRLFRHYTNAAQRERDGMVAILKQVAQEAKDEAKAEISELTQRYEERIGGLENSMEELRSREAQCEKANARLQAQLELMGLQLAVRDGYNTAVTMVCYLTTTYDGTIVDAEGSIVPIFGWRSTELIGQHINILIPERYIHNHDIIMARVRTEGLSRQHSSTAINGKRRDNSEVHLVMVLNEVIYNEAKCIRATVCLLNPS